MTLLLRFSYCPYVYSVILFAVVGFSDPYCMLGIQPASPFERRNSSDEEFNPQGSLRSSPGRRQGGLKKLGASLKRRDRMRSNSICDTLPAKFIRTTSVKPQTLNPRWNEKFRLWVFMAKAGFRLSVSFPSSFSTNRNAFCTDGLYRTDICWKGWWRRNGQSLRKSEIQDL